MWEKIVLNLQSNASRFTLQGGIEVTMHDEGGACAFDVRDSGIGSPPEALPHIFDAFSASRTPAGGRTRGSGIGLAWCTSW